VVITVLHSFIVCTQQLTVSQDEGAFENRRLVLAVDATLVALLKEEDTDEDGLITVDDSGPKVKLHLLNS